MVVVKRACNVARSSLSPENDTYRIGYRSTISGVESCNRNLCISVDIGKRAFSIANAVANAAFGMINAGSFGSCNLWI
jgi:hypothetical protein